LRRLRTEKEIGQSWQDKSATPLVSINCIAYNHEKYIEDAIEGFLIQETDFPFEIIVHDDASKDRTADIIREYEAQYPNLIKSICQTENQFSNGRNPLYEFTFPLSKGKYIALCEGDDYWTDKFKLTKQVDFLENNPSFSGSAHQSMLLYQNGKKNDKFFKLNNDYISLENLMAGRLFHTASFVFKNNILKGIQLPNNMLSGDRYLFLLCSMFGPIKYFSEPMCIYRKHDNGISHWITYELLKKDLNIPSNLYLINNKFPKYKYLSFVHQTLIMYPQKLPLDKFFYHYLMYIFFSFSDFPENVKKILLFSLRLPLLLYRKTYSSR